MPHLLPHGNDHCLSFKARDIKVVRPLYGVELFDGETARFEVEISEDDVHGQWRLNGDILSRSSVRVDFDLLFAQRDRSRVL